MRWKARCENRHSLYLFIAVDRRATTCHLTTGYATLTVPSRLGRGTPTETFILSSFGIEVRSFQVLRNPVQSKFYSDAWFSRVSSTYRLIFFSLFRNFRICIFCCMLFAFYCGAREWIFLFLRFAQRNFFLMISNWIELSFLLLVCQHS